LTKVISMIAEVANAKGDVNIVGPNASALLRYIRVVGVDIDLKVADRIWATGVLPALPPKKQGQGGKPAVGHKPGTPAPGVNGVSRPPAPPGAGNTVPPNAAGLKRKMDSVTGPSSTSVSSAPVAPHSTVSTASAPSTSGPVAGSAAAPITIDGGSEMKKTKLEGVTEVK
jgi:hypothetical protein